VVGTKKSGRPGGNPNITNVRKTGPRTTQGKFKILQSTLKDGKSSKLIQVYRARGCDFCPLRAKRYKIKFGDKEVERLEKPLCAYYLEGSRMCKAPLDDTVARIKNFELLQQKNQLDAYDELVKEGVVDLELARMKDIGVQGAPGKQTKEMREMLMKGIIDKQKLLMPQKIESKNLNMNMDITQAIIDAYKEDVEDEEKDKTSL